jgi:hypothetical protein
MKNRLLLPFAAGLLAVLSGCVSSGLLVSSNMTEVELSQANYRVVATSVSGQASAEYLFGASFGIGMYAQAYALIPLDKDRALYKIAVENLWKNFEALHGKTEGRSLALVNVRYDSEAVNAFVYTKPKLTVIADVVEFTK